MRRLAPLAAALLTACNMAVAVDPEGYRCDPGDVCPAGYACQAGVCHAAGGACTGVVCDQPPASTCTGGVEHGYVGACAPATGSCSYAPQDTPCPAGCDGATCKNLCASVGCVTPPAPSCLNGTTLQTFGAAGTCSAATGACEYPPLNTTCTNGCSQNRCQGQDLCLGKVCATPPPAVCNGNTSHSSAATGTCDPGTGVCAYAAVDTVCSGGCAAGVCVVPALTLSQVGPQLNFAVNAIDQAPVGGTVLAVGNGGKVSRWNGTTWSSLTTPAVATLNSVFFSSAGLAWVVGQNRTLWQVRNTTVAAPMNPPALSGGANLTSVHGTGDLNVLVVAENGQVAKLTTGVWSVASLPNSANAMKSAYIDETLRERVSGTCTSGGSTFGCVAYRSTAGGTWLMDIDTNTPSMDAVGGWVDIGTVNFDALVGRADNTLARHESTGNFSSTVPSLGAGNGVVGITAAPLALAATTRPTYVLTSSSGGNTGTLYRLSHATFGTSTVTAEALLETYFGEEKLSRNESSGVVVAEVLRTANVNNIFRRGPVATEALDLGEDFAAITADNAGALVLVTRFGDVAVKRPAAATFDFNRGPFVNVRGAEANHGAGVLVVGTDGTSGDGVIERTAAGIFSTATPTFPGVTFNGVCRVSNTEAWAVGSGGAIVGLSGLTATRATSPTQNELFAVDCPAAGQAVACGANGTVLTWNGTAWAAVTPAFPTTAALKSCVLRGGSLFVAGDRTFGRLDPGGPWHTVSAPTGLTRMVFRSPADIYGISGASGLSISRFDGTAWTTLASAPQALAGGVQIGSRVVWGGIQGVLMEGR